MQYIDVSQVFQTPIYKSIIMPPRRIRFDDEPEGIIKIRELHVYESELHKWELLERLDEDMKRSIKFFKPHDDRMYVALTDDRLIGIGDNSDGLLGAGHCEPVETFVDISEFRNVTITDLACGSQHVLVLTARKQVWSWGRNVYREVGAGDLEPHLKPVCILDGGIIQISTAGYHSLALNEDCKVLAWGENSYGQVGTGNNCDQLRPTLVEALADKDITRVSAGLYHSVVLDSEHKAHAWGQYFDTSPAPISIDNDNATIKEISSCHDQTVFLTHCGLVYSITNNAPSRRLLVTPANGKYKYMTLVDSYFIILWTRTTKMAFARNPANRNMIRGNSTSAMIIHFFGRQFMPHKLMVYPDDHERELVYSDEEE